MGSVFLVIFACSFGLVKPTDSEADRIQGIWFNAKDSQTIEIYKVENNSMEYVYAGKIVGLSEANKNKSDKNNADTLQRNKPLIGLLILSGFMYDKEAQEWSGGLIYDPASGKKQSAYILLNGLELNIREFKGIGMIGKTSAWKRKN